MGQKAQADHPVHIFLSRKQKQGKGISWDSKEPKGIDDVIPRTVKSF